jgi:HK97 family phage prohead protease
MSAPIDNLVRAWVAPDATELRAKADGGDTMVGHFAVFNSWTEIHSAYEGQFLERIAPGAFDDSFTSRSNQIRVLYDHGADPMIGNKPLGTPDVLREDDTGAYYEVSLFDASYVNDLKPAIRSGQVGASFRFKVTGEEWASPTASTPHNPQRLDERTITGVSSTSSGRSRSPPTRTPPPDCGHAPTSSSNTSSTTRFRRALQGARRPGSRRTHPRQPPAHGDGRHEGGSDGAEPGTDSDGAPARDGRDRRRRRGRRNHSDASPCTSEHHRVRCSPRAPQGGHPMSVNPLDYVLTRMSEIKPRFEELSLKDKLETRSGPSTTARRPSGTSSTSAAPTSRSASAAPSPPVRSTSR